MNLSSFPDELKELSQAQLSMLAQLETMNVQNKNVSLPFVVCSDLNMSNERLFRTITAMTVANQSLELTDSDEEENTETDTIDVECPYSDNQCLTWTEICEEDAHRLEEQAYAETKEKLNAELEEVNQMVRNSDGTQWVLNKHAIESKWLEIFETQDVELHILQC